VQILYELYPGLATCHAYNPYLNPCYLFP
jgi:hypothetical protein